MLDLWGCFGAVFAPVLSWLVTMGNQTCNTFAASTPGSSIRLQSSSLPLLKSITTSKAVDIVAFTLDVVNLVAGLVEVEIGMLDGHVRSV